MAIHYIPTQDLSKIFKTTIRKEYNRVQKLIGDQDLRYVFTSRWNDLFPEVFTALVHADTNRIINVSRKMYDKIINPLPSTAISYAEGKTAEEVDSFREKQNHFAEYVFEVFNILLYIQCGKSFTPCYVTLDDNYRDIPLAEGCQIYLYGYDIHADDFLFMPVQSVVDEFCNAVPTSIFTKEKSQELFTYIRAANNRYYNEYVGKYINSRYADENLENPLQEFYDKVRNFVKEYFPKKLIERYSSLLD